MSREDQIKYAEQIIACGCSDELKAILEKDFPELKESEDERMRRKLIDHLDWHSDNRLTHEECDELRDWLEKQKDSRQKIVLDNPLSGETNKDWCVIAPLENKEWTDELSAEIDRISKRYPEVSFAKLTRIAVHFVRWQKEQKPIKVLYIPKFRTGDLVRSSKNPRLTYKILSTWSMNEFGNPEYEVEIFTDGKPDEPRNLKHIEIEKMDSWGELVKQNPVECSKNNKDKPILTILVDALKGNAQLEWELKSAGVDVKKLVAYIEEQTEELSTRLNGLMQEYVKSGKDEEEQEHRLKCYQLFWDALGDSEFFEQKEQKPVDNVSKEEYVKRFKALCDAYEIKLPNREYDIYHLCDDLSKLSIDSGEQNHAEWSEEDNDSILIAIDWMRFYRDRFAIYKETKDEINTCIKRLNSLCSCPKSSNYWKPNEEQMEALKEAMYQLDGSKYSNGIDSLFNDLKSL